MAGLDVGFDHIDPYIRSPVPFPGQSIRRPFNKYGVFGAKTINENRFVANEKDLTPVRSKYAGDIAPIFGKAQHSLDEFIKNESSSATESVNNIMYDANFHLAERNTFLGVPNFSRYTKRKAPKVVGMQILTSVDHDKLANSLQHTVKQSPEACPFQALMGRDNLYERVHGLPKETKEETVKKAKKYQAYVSSTEFLPNSVLKSPQRNLHSNTVKTQ